MFIRKTVSKSRKNNKEKYYTYRLVESTRVGEKVKQTTLLNLGPDFNLPQKDWSTLSTRISQIIRGISPLFEIDSNIEFLAQQYANQIILSQSTESITASDYQEIDLDSIKNSDAKTIGVENVLYETIQELKLEDKLKELNFTKTQINSALGVLIAKASEPSSEAGTLKWLRNSSGAGELYNCDYNKISLNNIYRISDNFLKHKDELESYIYQSQKNLFNHKETITLYDLTNTYFEGKSEKLNKAKRGRSKEKRSDAPLVTLAVVLDGSGFVKKSKVYEGNISEPKTLQKMINRIEDNTKETRVEDKALIVMDAGIATEENILYLKNNNYEYIVVSRKRKKQFNDEKSVPVKINKRDNTVVVKAQRVENIETDEVELYCYSEPRAAKENAMESRVEKLFIESLEDLKLGLNKAKKIKRYEKVIEKIGRLKEKFSSASKNYNITVNKALVGDDAVSISWTKKTDKENSFNGVYCLRTNNKTLDEMTLWKTYTMLTDLESVFKSLKSELGLRPIYHQKQVRVDGHLFITLLAYSIIHTIRYKLKAKGFFYSWNSIRNILKQQIRVSTSAKCKNGKVVHIRKSTEKNAEQKAIYKVLNIKNSAGGTTKIYL